MIVIHDKQLLDYADTIWSFKLKFDQDLKPTMNVFKVM